MIKHTPGPWGMYDIFPGKRVRITSQGGDGADIAELCPEDIPSEDELEANARLIAAAPELLDLLWEVNDEYDDTGCDGCGVIGNGLRMRIARMLDSFRDCP